MYYQQWENMIEVMVYQCHFINEHPKVVNNEILTDNLLVINSTFHFGNKKVTPFVTSLLVYWVKLSSNLSSLLLVGQIFQQKYGSYLEYYIWSWKIENSRMIMIMLFHMSTSRQIWKICLLNAEDLEG